MLNCRECPVHGGRQRTVERGLITMDFFCLFIPDDHQSHLILRESKESPAIKVQKLRGGHKLTDIFWQSRTPGKAGGFPIGPMGGIRKGAFPDKKQYIY